MKDQNLMASDATHAPPYTDEDRAEVAAIFGELDPDYRLLRESEARGNAFVKPDLDAEAVRLGYSEIERDAHRAMCGDAQQICDIINRGNAAKAKLPSLAAKAEEIRRHIWDNPPLNRQQQLEQQRQLSEARQALADTREIVADINRYAWMLDKCIDPRVYADLHNALDELQKLRDRHEELRREVKPAVVFDTVSVEAGDQSYTARRPRELGEEHWERVTKYADRSTAAGEKEYREAERELLRLKKAKRQLAENAVAIDQLTELVAELERRPLRAAFFRM